MPPTATPAKTGVQMKASEAASVDATLPAAPPRTSTAIDESPAPVHARSTRTWSVLVFMKPDEALEKAAIDDVQEMKSVGRLDHAYVAVQVERVNDVERMEIDAGQELLHQSPDAPRPVAMERRIGAFMDWAMNEFPSRHRMAVLWGHARGVGFELGPAAADSDRERRAPGGADAAAFGEWAPSFAMASGASDRSVRGIAPSDGLTIPLLARLVRDLKGCTPKGSGSGSKADYASSASGSEAARNRTLDLLGLDSCYMSSIECGYELQGCVEYLVASESFMLNQGWNYGTVLGALAQSSMPSPEAFGEAIVQHVTTLPGDGSISMLRLKAMPELGGRVRTLVRALRERIADPIERRALKIVLSRVSFLKVRQFLDLRDLCHKLTQYFDGAVADAATGVLDQLPAVVFHQAHGIAAGRLNGLSIFYPYVRASALPARNDGIGEVNAIVSPHDYRQLEFVKETGWGDLLNELFGD